jgi:hypothetical protein
VTACAACRRDLPTGTRATVREWAVLAIDDHGHHVWRTTTDHVCDDCEGE